MDMFTLLSVLHIIPAAGHWFAITGGIGLFGAALLTGIAGLCTLDERDTEEIFKQRFKSFMILPLFITCLILSFIGTMVPNQKTLILAIGISSATSIEGIDKLPPKLMKVLNQELDKILKVEDK
jgi:hypothetical protein